jgi:hypothetical protein
VGTGTFLPATSTTNESGEGSIEECSNCIHRLVGLLMVMEML